MKVTRREVAAALLAGVPAAGQQPAAPAAADELAAARETLARNAEALTQYEVAITTEPAFVFRTI
ncbi:MAG: hypothetical protein SFV54_15735 [Bryobacteraceae bacterium]|nr:hypothetical protein [Bryobacteraceae bacterium]